MRDFEEYEDYYLPGMKMEVFHTLFEAIKDDVPRDEYKDLSKWRMLWNAQFYMRRLRREYLKNSPSVTHAESFLYQYAYLAVALKDEMAIHHVLVLPMRDYFRAADNQLKEMTEELPDMIDRLNKKYSEGEKDFSP